MFCRWENSAQNYYDISDENIIAFLQVGPVAASVSAADWTTYGSGVFSCPPNSNINHAVLLVGDTPDYWIIKNQWGDQWG